MNKISSDEDGLQLFPDKDEVMDRIMDYKYIYSEVNKFFFFFSLFLLRFSYLMHIELLTCSIYLI